MSEYMKGWKRVGEKFDSAGSKERIYRKCAY